MKQQKTSVLMTLSGSLMLVSALVMVACGLLMKKPKLKWLSDYALPISLVLGMIAAIPITAILG